MTHVSDTKPYATCAWCEHEVEIVNGCYADHFLSLDGTRVMPATEQPPHGWALCPYSNRPLIGNAPVVEPEPCGHKPMQVCDKCEGWTPEQRARVNRPVVEPEQPTPLTHPIVDGCRHTGPCTDRCEPLVEPDPALEGEVYPVAGFDVQNDAPVVEPEQPTCDHRCPRQPGKPCRCDQERAQELPHGSLSNTTTNRVPGDLMVPVSKVSQQLDELMRENEALRAEIGRRKTAAWSVKQAADRAWAEEADRV